MLTNVLEGLTMFAYKLKRHVLWEQKLECVRVKWWEEERKRSCCPWQQPCCYKQQSVWAGSWVWVDVILLLHVFIISFSLSLIKWTSPVDVGNLPNHVKYCVSVFSLLWTTIRTPPVRAWGSRNPQHVVLLESAGWAFATNLQLVFIFFDNWIHLPFKFLFPQLLLSWKSDLLLLFLKFELLECD